MNKRDEAVLDFSPFSPEGFEQARQNLERVLPLKDDGTKEHSISIWTPMGELLTVTGKLGAVTWFVKAIDANERKREIDQKLQEERALAEKEKVDAINTAWILGAKEERERVAGEVEKIMRCCEYGRDHIAREEVISIIKSK